MTTDLNTVKLAPELYNEFLFAELLANRGSIQVTGPIGCSKTAHAMQYALEFLPAKLGVKTGYVHVPSPTEEIFHARGHQIPRVLEAEATSEMEKPFQFGNKRLAMLSAQPEWHRRVCDLVASGCKAVVINLDESDKMAKDVSKAYAQLLYEQLIGPAVLPQDIYAQVISCANRRKDRTGSVGGNTLNHIVNRLAAVELNMTFDHWRVWAEANGVHWATRAFFGRNPDLVLASEPPTDGTPFCTIRSLTAADRAIQTHAHVLAGTPVPAYRAPGMGTTHIDSETYARERERAPEMPSAVHDLPNDDLAAALVQSHIGVAAGQQYLAMAGMAHKTASYDEVVKDPLNAQVPGEEELDAGVGQLHILLHGACERDIEPVMIYCDRMPEFTMVSLFERLIDKLGEALVKHPAYDNFLQKNQNVVMDQLGFE